MASNPSHLEWHETLAREYLLLPHRPEHWAIAESYRTFRRELINQYDAMVQTGLTVRFTRNDPYKTPEQLFASIHAGLLQVYTGGDLPENHPLRASVYGKTSIRQSGITYNDIFRAVHDYYGHYGANPSDTHVPFGIGRYIDGDTTSLFNEEEAFRRHRRYFSAGAWLALANETRCQTACNNLLDIDGGFVEQKCVLLPAWAFTE